MQDDEEEEHHAQRQQQAQHPAQNRRQRTDGQHRQHREHHAHEAAQLHADKAVFDIALHRKEHDVAQKDEPAVLKLDGVKKGVGDQDPRHHHQAEVEQETLGHSFVHGKAHFLASACKSGWPVVFVSDEVIILGLETKGNIYLLIYAIKTCQTSKNSFVLLPGVVWSIIKP